MKSYEELKKEEAADGQFWMIIEDVFELINKGVAVVGKVAGAPVHKNQEIIIKRADGTEIQTIVDGIEIYQEGLVPRAEVGQPIGMCLVGIEKADIAKGDRIMGIVSKEYIDKMKAREELHVLYFSQTGLPFVGMGCAEVYTKEEYATQAVKHYEEAYPGITSKKVTQKGSPITGGLPLFGYLYYLGIEQVLVDNGVTGVMLKRSDFLEAPDWSKLKEEEVPVNNPVLRRLMNRYIVELRSKISYEGQQNAITALEQQVIEHLKEATYLLPVQQDGSVALITDQQGNEFLPIFTDWMECEKIYKRDLWGGMKTSLEQAISVGMQKKGIVINPMGENMTFNCEMIEKIFG